MQAAYGEKLLDDQLITSVTRLQEVWSSNPRSVKFYTHRTHRFNIYAIK